MCCWYIYFYCIGYTVKLILQHANYHKRLWGYVTALNGTQQVSPFDKGFIFYVTSFRSVSRQGYPCIVIGFYKISLCLASLPSF